MSTVNSLLAFPAAVDVSSQVVSRSVALDRVRRFLQLGGRRAAGPLRAEVDAASDAVRPRFQAAPEASVAYAETGEPCWVAALETAPSSVAALHGLLHAVPADVADVAVLAHVRTADERLEADRAAFSAGFRRHPLLFSCVTYAGLEDEVGWLVLPYERVSTDVLTRYPGERLAVESGLHMDMTRVAGARSDAHLARYRLASERLPADARVLDAACGFGYGSALLAREAPRRTVTGLDIAEWVVEYAAASFGVAGTGPRFRRADVCDLGAFDEAGFDAVVSFETLEHLLDPEPFLREIRRVLATGGCLVASVPYLWIEDGDTGATHHDWFDARKLLALIERFLSVEELWVQTAGRGRFSAGFRRGFRRCETLGEEPDGDIEWLIVVARKRAVAPATTHPWLFVAPGLAELTTMAALHEARGGRSGDVVVVDQADVADNDRAVAYRAACEALGFHYHGRTGCRPALENLGDPLDFPAPDAAAPEEAERRLRDACPILDDFAGRSVAMAVKPQATGDVALLQGLRSRETRLVGHALPADYGVRDVTGVPGLASNPLALLPPTVRIDSPSWVSAMAHGHPGLGPNIACLDSLAYGAALRALTTVRSVADWLADIRDRARPYETLLLCEPLISGELTTADAALTFYQHQVRDALRRTHGSVLVRPHPDEAPRVVRALATRLAAEGERVRVMDGAARYFPVGLWQPLVERVEALHVWAGSAIALAETCGWRGVSRTTVEADYLEPEVRGRARQALAYDALEAHHLSLRIADDLLSDGERAGLRRRWKPAPSDARVEEWRMKVRQVDDERRAARVRVEDTMLRLLEAEERIRLGELERAQAARHTAFCEALLHAGAARTWIWGAGASGRALLRHLRTLGVEPAGFLDGRAGIEPRAVDGLTVYAVDQAPAARAAGGLIIIASMYAEDILQRMRDEGTWAAHTLTWTE